MQIFREIFFFSPSIPFMFPYISLYSCKSQESAISCHKLKKSTHCVILQRVQGGGEKKRGVFAFFPLDRCLYYII